MSGSAADHRQVLVVLHDELLNGASISILRAAPLLEERGWRFSFWVPQPGPAADYLLGRGAHVLGEPRPIVSGLQHLRQPPGVIRRLCDTPGYLRRFRGALDRVRPALVHANSLFSYAEALSSRAAGWPTLLHLHDMAPRSRKVHAARWLVRHGVDVAVAASASCAASYRHNDGWSPRIVYEAAPVPAEPVAIRASPRPFVVGSVGVVSRRKGTDLFIEAARALQKSTEAAFEFRLVGEPTDTLESRWGHALVREARENGITCIPKADVLQELRSWDAFVLPSRMDPFPIVMLEAMASGLPVIGTRVDGLAEQITEETGILVEPDSAAALAAGIRSVAEMAAGARTRMGLAARARVEARFSLDEQADRLDHLYGELLALRRRRSRLRSQRPVARR